MRVQISPRLRNLCLLVNLVRLANSRPITKLLPLTKDPNMSPNRKPKGSPKNAKGKGTGGQFASKPVASQPPMNMDVEMLPKDMGTIIERGGDILIGKARIKTRPLNRLGRDKNILYRFVLAEAGVPIDNYWTKKRILNIGKTSAGTLEVYFGWNDRYARGWHDNLIFKEKERDVDTRACLTMLGLDIDKTQFRIFGGYPVTEENLRSIDGAIQKWWPNKLEEMVDEKYPPLSDTSKNYIDKTVEHNREIGTAGESLWRQIDQDLGPYKDRRTEKDQDAGERMKIRLKNHLDFCVFRSYDYNDKFTLNIENPTKMICGIFHILPMYHCGHSHTSGTPYFQDWLNDIKKWVTDWTSLNPSINYCGALYSIDEKIDDIRNSVRLDINTWHESKYHLSRDHYYEDLCHASHMGAEFLKFLTKHFESFPKRPN